MGTCLKFIFSMQAISVVSWERILGDQVVLSDIRDSFSTRVDSDFDDVKSHAGNCMILPPPTNIGCKVNEMVQFTIVFTILYLQSNLYTKYPSRRSNLLYSNDMAEPA